MKAKKFWAFLLPLLMCFCLLQQAAVKVRAVNITFEAMDGTTNSGDGYANLIDGNVKTKWGCNWGGSYGTNAQVIIKASQEITMDGYTLVTANDCRSFRNRNPKGWTLSGCNDYDPEQKTGSWKTIHTVTNDAVLEDKNNKAYTYSFENDAAYRYYKLQITANKGNNYMQIGEMRFAYTVPQAIRFTPLDGTTGLNNESYDKLFDTRKTEGNHTKWCVDGAAPYFVVAKADVPVIVSEYIFNTANDTVGAPGRNPKSWTLYGCNDYDEQNKTGGSWEVIDAIEDDTTMPSASYTPQSFGCADNTKSYQYYKLEITAVQDGNIMQLAELEFTYTVCEHEWGEPTRRIEATCLEPEYSIWACTKCAYPKTEETAPANGHTWAVASVKSATCLEAEYTTYHCENCEETRTEQTAAANGHTWAVESVKTATCLEAEYTTYRCENCEETKTEQTGPTGDHQYDENGVCIFCQRKMAAKIENNFYESLSEALEAAADGDKIVLLQNAGIENTLNITENNLTLDLNGFTVTKVGSGSVIVLGEEITFTLTDSSGNRAAVTGGSAENGGGVYVGRGGMLFLSDVSVSKCSAQNGGGVYLADGGKLSMNGSMIFDCTASGQGGAVAAYSGSTVDVGDNNELSKNVSSGDGGAIYADNSTVRVNGGSVFQYNRAENYSGGAIYAKNNSSVTIGGYCTFSENTAEGNGGGVYAYNSTVTMENGNVFLNKATYGGGIYIHASVFVMDDGEILNNTASKFGGGIMVQIDNAKSVATINGGSVSGNIAENEANGGGGIWVNGSQRYSATLTVNGGHISDNIAKNGYGGGIRVQNSYAYLNLNGGTIMGNSALRGGGVENDGNMTVSGAPHVYANTLYSENGEDNTINNIYLPRNNTIKIGEGGLHTDPETYVEPMIGVTLENPSAYNTVAECDSDYSYGFQSDDTKYVTAYDAENKKVILAESICIILDPQVEEAVPIEMYVMKGGIPEEPTYEPWRMGYRFLGWYQNGERYDFGRVVTEGFTLTAKWAKEDEAAIVLTSDSFIVSGFTGDGIVYLTSCDENGAIIDIKRITATNVEIPIAKTLLNTEGASQIKAFLWDENMTPACESTFKTLR